VDLLAFVSPPPAPRTIYCKTPEDEVLIDLLNRMAGAMLILLAACKIPALKEVMAAEVVSAGDHLLQLLTDWQAVMGEPSSPSVDQSFRIIEEADRFIRQVYGAGMASRTPE
jgi:hypothetical protein